MCYKNNGDDLNKWTYVQCDDGCISNCSDNVYELWKLKKFAILQEIFSLMYVKRMYNNTWCGKVYF